MSTDAKLYASMGPASENAGYDHERLGPCAFRAGFNGSSVRERWLWRAKATSAVREMTASMGPASENAGYADWIAMICYVQELQWVQRPRTLVMPAGQSRHAAADALQWVQRPRTLVMPQLRRSTMLLRRLQWVQRPRTLVMLLQSPLPTALD